MYSEIRVKGRSTLLDFIILIIVYIVLTIDVDQGGDDIGVDHGLCDQKLPINFGGVELLGLYSLAYIGWVDVQLSGYIGYREHTYYPLSSVSLRIDEQRVTVLHSSPRCCDPLEIPHSIRINGDTNAEWHGLSLVRVGDHVLPLVLS